MKLNFDIICDSLQGVYPLQRFGAAATDLHIAAPRFYRGDCSSDYIYLLTASAPPEHFDAPAVWIGLENEVPEHVEYPLAVVCRDIPATELMNALLQVFDEYRVWDESLQECVDKHLSLPELAGRGSSKIGCRILINDKRLVLLSDSQFYQASPDMPLNYQGETLPADVVQIFSENSAEFQKQKMPYFAGEDGSYQNHRVYNINIFLGGRYEGTCSLMEDDRVFRESDFALFRHFFQYAFQQFQFFYGTPGKQDRAFRSVIKALLEQRQPNEKMKELIAPYEYRYSHFQCMVLTDASGSLLPDEYLCFTVESLFNESISLVHENRVAALIPQLQEADLSRLYAVIEPLQLYTGLSNRGTRISEVSALYMQASVAADIGIRENPRQNVHVFSQYALQYLLRHSAGEFSVDAFKTEGFRRLEAFNAESAVDYIHTLRVYLDLEMNISESARRLYLHRSSFLKRLERIREMLGDELETPESRLLLRWLLYQAGDAPAFAGGGQSKQ